MHPAVESYLVRNTPLSTRQLARAVELTSLWRGTVPVVLWKLGWIDLATFSVLLDIQSQNPCPVL